MNLLFVSALDPTSRSIHTISKYIEAAQRLGHKISIFGKPDKALPTWPYSLDLSNFDYAVFVVHIPEDFPPLPDLARLLDGIPRQRRVVIDCWGRFNETIRVDHDFNHLEKLDGHQGWEWIDALKAVSGKILQPASEPLRRDVRSFLFHAFDPGAILRPYSTAGEAVKAWSRKTKRRPYGIVYVGNNWQRWPQVSRFLQQADFIGDEWGRPCLAGWHWDRTPQWVADLGLHAADLDRDLLKRLGVKTFKPVPHQKVTQFLGKGRICPIFQRPLFQHLGIVSNRCFEVFGADVIPILNLPKRFVEEIWGPAALKLVPTAGAGRFLRQILDRPHEYWDAVLKTREHLARRHSFEGRIKELLSILEN